MKRTLLILIILILAVGGWYAYQMYQEKTPDVVKNTPDIVISATELIAAFDRDTAAASKRFIDRIVEVSGQVKRVDTTGSVVLGDEGSASEVTIGLDRRHIADHQKLTPGTRAVLQGVCSGYEQGAGDDLLAGLGTTVQIRSAGVKDNN